MTKSSGAILDGESRPEGRGVGTAPRNRPIGSSGEAAPPQARGVIAGLLAVALAAVSVVASAAAPSGETSGADLAKLKEVVNSDQRSAANKARDKYRDRKSVV